MKNNLLSLKIFKKLFSIRSLLKMFFKSENCFPFSRTATKQALDEQAKCPVTIDNPPTTT